MSVNITTSSRLNFDNLLTADGIEFWDVVDLPEFTPRKSDIQYQVKDGDRADILAYLFYQDQGLWWVIAWANGMELIPSALTGGMKIVIPDPVYVKTKLFSDIGS